MLLHKLLSLGITLLLDWIKCYLQNQMQSVVINGSHSDYAAVTSGFSQGSVLGPLLFLLYINDIAQDVSCRLYADDCVIYLCIRSPTDHEYLQHNSDCIMRWSIRWRMSLNPSKCQSISFTRKYDPYLFDYTLDTVQSSPE